MTTKIIATLVAVGILLGGCASNPTTDDSLSKNDITNLSAQEAIQRGDMATSEGKTDEALSFYVQALDKDGKNDTALCKVAMIHESKGNFGLAADAYKIAISAAPRNVTALEGLGLIEVEQHQYSDAETHLNAAIGVEPTRWRSLNGLGLIADQRKDYGRAIALYGRAISAQPNLPVLHNNLGYSKYLSRDYSGAKAAFSKALSMDPKYERAVLNMGLLLARTGQDDEAFSMFRNIMDEAEAYNNLGYIYMLEGKYPEAEEFFQRSISLSPTYNERANTNMVRLRELWRRDAESR